MPERPSNARAAGRWLVLLCGVVPALLTVALAVARPPLLTQLDRRVYDGFLRGLPASPQDSSRVTVIDIDDRSLATIGQWPWSRDVVARLVTRLREMGAVVVALDVIFPETDRFQPLESTRAEATDGALASVVQEGNVVVGYAFTFDDGSAPIDELRAKCVDDAGCPVGGDEHRVAGLSRDRRRVQPAADLRCSAGIRFSERRSRF